MRLFAPQLQLSWIIALGLMSAPVPARASERAPLDQGIQHLEREWARIKYQVPNPDLQLEQMKALAQQAAALVAQYHDRPEPLVWNGIITATEAGLAGSFGALGYAKSARAMFEAANRLDPDALKGAIPTSLGSLYYLVPGFPLGFGDNAKARQYLEQGVAMSPDGLDSNFFYGDFLFRQGELAKAKQVLTHVLAAPAHPERPIWDKGRRGEVRDILAKIDQKLAASR